MANSLLDALGWVGESLDKPGAAVRGLLAGDTGQLANLIPFSDTLGITDPSQRVSGRGLLEHYGLVSPKEEGAGFDLGDLAGMATEFATDPTNLIGGAALKKLIGVRHAAQESNALRVKSMMMNRESEELLRHGAMPEEIANLTKVRNEAGPVKTFHGTPNVFDKYDMAKMDPEGLYGPGIYTTVDPAIASEYADKGAKDSVYFLPKEGGMEAIQRRIDLLQPKIDATKGFKQSLMELPEASMTERQLEQLERLVNLGTEQRSLKDVKTLMGARGRISEEYGWRVPNVHKHLERVEELAPRNVRSQFLDVRNPFDADVNSELYRNLVSEAGGNKARVNNLLGEMGYDAITHEGGGRVGNKAHQVYIAFDPKQVYQPMVAPALRHVPDFMSQPRLSPLLSALAAHNAGARFGSRIEE